MYNGSQPVHWLFTDFCTFVTIGSVLLFGSLGHSGWNNTVAHFKEDFDRDPIPGPTWITRFYTRLIWRQLIDIITFPYHVCLGSLKAKLCMNLVCHFITSLEHVESKSLLDPHLILCPLWMKTFQPDNQLKRTISGYFKQLNPNKSWKQIEKALLNTMPSWGKVRIAQGSDSICTLLASHDPDKERNMAFVRVSGYSSLYVYMAM